MPDITLLSHEEVDNFITLQLSSAFGETNHDIFEKRLSDPAFPNHKFVPACVYFFYVSFRGPGPLSYSVDHFFYYDGRPDDPKTWKEITEAEIAGVVQMLGERARKGDPADHYILPDKNFRNICFRRISYFVILVDAPAVTFHQSQGMNAIVFDGQGSNTPNHSFFDAGPTPPMVTLDGVDDRPVIAMINHMKVDDNVLGTLLPDDKIGQKFKFTMFFDAPFADGTPNPDCIRIDPGGTNMGPPEPPPP